MKSLTHRFSGSCSLSCGSLSCVLNGLFRYEMGLFRVSSGSPLSFRKAKRIGIWAILPIWTCGLKEIS